MFGIMDGVNKKGRPHEERCDDSEEWCGSSLQDLSHRAMNMKEWPQTVEMALCTNTWVMMVVMMKLLVKS